jgi:[ribosomal protein S5]-alanine N-acetyltransferase
MYEQKKVALVDFSIKDINSEYLSWLNDIEVTQFSELRHVKQDFKTAADYIRRMYELNNKIFSIITPNEKHIGNITLRFDYENNNVAISILIGNKDYWGKGYAKDAINVALDWLRKDTNMLYLTAGTMKLNIPMIKVFKTLGFELDEDSKSFFDSGHRRVDMFYFRKKI